MRLPQNLVIICASLAAGLISPALAAQSSSSTAAGGAPIYLPDPVPVTYSSAFTSSPSLSSSSSTVSSRPSSAISASSPSSSLASPPSALSTSPLSSSAESTLAIAGPPIPVLKTVPVNLVVPTLTSRLVKTGSASGTSASFLGSIISTYAPGVTNYHVACPDSVKPTECGIHSGMKIWSGPGTLKIHFTIEQEGTQPFWSLRQYCTLTSPYYTCTTILLGTTSLTTFPFSVLWEKEFPVGITGGLEKLAPGGGITAALINTATNSTETPFLDGFGTALSLTTINLSTRPTVMPLHFPIVTKDAKDKDIHWGASLAYVSSDVQYSDVSAYIVNCIEPKKAVLKECGSFFYGGITVKTGPTYYGYGFMYAIDSDMHTKECHCIHPLSPGELKNGKDDIGVCTSIWGPTGAPTTKVSTRVTSISASLANTTPVTVTSGVWVGPIETAETKEGGAAGRLDPPGRGMGMGMGLGGDVGAVLMAVVVGGLVGVLGVVL